jgi:hypothetical protein
MAETGNPTSGAENGAPASSGRTKDEVSLELMRFITLQTGYGKSPQSSAGFSGKPGLRSAEEHAEALLELFLRCRQVVNQED